LEGLKPGEIDSVLIKAVDAAKIAGTLQDWQIEGQADLKARVVKAEQDITGKAKASDVSVLSATVGGFSSSITQISQAQAALDGKVSSKWGVVLEATTDGRKKLSGVQAFNDGSVSQFIISADQVLITGGANLHFDPQYKDPSKHTSLIKTAVPGQDGCPSASFSRAGLFNGRDDVAPYGYSCRGGERYRVEVYAANGSSGDVRGMIVYFGGKDGWTQFAYSVFTSIGPTAEFSKVVGVFSIPEGCTEFRLGPWISQAHSGPATVWFGGWSIEKMASAELIVDGAITAEKIRVTSLQSVNARTGNLIVDGGGSICSSNFPNSWSWPAAGQTGFHISERGMLLGNPNYGNGSFFHYDVQNGGLEVRNGTVRASKIEASEINGSTFNARAGVDSNAGFQVFHPNGVALVRLGIFP
jgi:hypothetical protein